MIELEYVVFDGWHPPHYNANFVAKENRWFYVQSKTKIRMDLGDGLIEYPENYGVLFPPNKRVIFSAVGAEELMLHWFSFYVDDTFSLPASVPVLTPISLPFPFFTYDIIHMLAVENCFPGNFNQSSYECLLQLLFNKLSEAVYLNSNAGSDQSLIKLRMRVYNNPGYPWNVHEMAQQLHISPGYMHNIYKKSFGISCMEDVIIARMEQAKRLLRENNQNINKISEECGYLNTEHFYRQFKKRTGITPRQFRLKSLKNTTLSDSPLVQDKT